MFIRATRGRAEFHWTACGKGFCFPGHRRISIFCSPLILGRKAKSRFGEAFRSVFRKSRPSCFWTRTPYAVVSEGKQYWIQDAYTTSDRFPYSQPQTSGSAEGINYIRNSVKAVVDMYDGTVSFYIMDPKDPVLALYRRAFPGVFKDLSELSADLKSHLRYPQDLFAIQATQYESFHMTDPQVFYNREDLWVAPLGEIRRRSQPYGALLHPDEASRERST